MKVTKVQSMRSFMILFPPKYPHRFNHDLLLTKTLNAKAIYSKPCNTCHQCDGVQLHTVLTDL